MEKVNGIWGGLVAFVIVWFFNSAAGVQIDLESSLDLGDLELSLRRWTLFFFSELVARKPIVRLSLDELQRICSHGLEYRSRCLW
jgi:hypothetical protein